MQNPPSPPDPAVCGTAAAPNCVPFSFTSSETRNNAFAYGWAAGGGLDVLVFPNVFLRGEYEYLSFGSVSGIRASINSGRVGVGLKF